MANVTGLITINETALLEIDGDPRLSGGLDRAIGDIAIDTLLGVVYIKKTLSPTGWEELGQGGSSSLPSVDFNFKGRISVNANSNFSVGSLGARVISEEDRLLEVSGSASVNSNGSLKINNGSVSVRRA